MKKLFTFLLVFVSLSAPSQTSYYVNDASQTGDVFTTAVGNDANSGIASAPLATILEAVNRAQNGDIIYVDAGDYPLVSEILINKTITLLGSNYLISPNNSVNKPEYNILRNAETRITGARLALAADGIIIKGFRFSPNGSALGTATNTNLKNIVVEKNYIDVVGGGGTTIVLGGTAFNPTTATNYTLHDNRFTRIDLSTGPMLDINGLKDVFIDNNVFIESAATTNRGTAIRTSGGRIVENINITNNYIKEVNNGIVTFILRNALIQNNVFDSCSQGFNMTPNTHPGPLGSSNISITQNQFKDSRFGRAVLLRAGENGVSNFTISNNTINQSVNGITGVVSVIQLEYINTATFGTTQVLNNVINISGDYLQNNVGSNNAIQLTGNHSNTTIAGNELNFTAINATTPAVAGVFPPVPTGIYIRTDGNVGYGTIPATAIINISSNKITGFNSSIGIYDPTAAGTTANVGYGFLTTGATVNINNNSMTGDIMSIDNGTVSQQVNASCNWFGSALTSAVTTKISSTVTYSPWLIEGSDNSSVVGFQHSGTCNAANNYFVNDNNQSGDVFTTAIGNDAGPGTFNAPFATLFYALSQATPGSTIYIDAGVYNPPFNLSINKPLTILGPNHNITPLDATRLNYNEDRNEEAFINGVLISLASDNITIKGLIFDPGAKVQLSKPDNGVSLSNVVISKNGFISTSNQGLINLVGKTSDVLASTNFIIEDNGFVKRSGTIGQSITLNGVSGVNIINNSFFNEETATDWQHAIHLGAGSKVNNILIKGNLIDRAFAPLFSNLVGDMVIDSNKVYSMFTSFSVQSNSTDPCTTTFTRNYVYIDRPLVNVTLGRSNATNISAPNAIVVDSNVVDVNVDGFTSSPTVWAYLNAQCNSTSVNVSYLAKSNVVNFNGTFGTFTSFIAGLRANGKFIGVTLEDNEINFNTSNFPGATSNSFAMIIQPNTGLTNIMPPGSVINVTGNKTSGFERGLQFLGSPVPGVIANINNNSLVCSDLAIIHGFQISPSVNASCNWYGTTSLNSITPKIFTSAPGAVIYSPWLLDGTDDEPLTPGFQPVDGACNGTPPVITLIAANDITCFGANNGSIDITISGGSEPYTISWTKEEGENFSSSSDDLTNLSPGTYDLTVTDANGSIVTLEVFIDEPLLLEASANGTNNLCFGESNGTASVLAEGGTSPYSYLWNMGATTDAIEGLAAGIYSVTVTDANGCTASANYEVTQPTLLTASITNNSTACSNIATASGSGGTTPYTYLWSNGGTSATISSVPAGIYSVTITDNNGCTALANVTLAVTEAFNPSASVTDVNCFGANTGVITVTNVNGTAPFSFSFDGINFVQGTLPYNFTGLAAGTYTIAVRDVNGCTGFVTKTITQPTQLTATLNSVQTTCFGLSTGSANVIVAGGSPSYSYAWTGPGTYSSTQLNISGLAAGNYSLTVTDNKGCNAVLPVAVTAFNQITTSPVIQNVSCKNGNNGSIILNTSGGTGNFSYSWNSGQTTGSIYNLTRNNNYTVTITDIGSGCTLVQTFAITEPATLVSVTTPTQEIANVSGCVSLGSFKAVGDGGTPFPNPDQYRYSIDGVNFQASQIFSNLNADTYTITVKDLNGCTATRSVTIGDNGSDEYESLLNVPNNNNNNKGKAAPISLGATIIARIGIAGDVDYYKLGSSNLWTGSYTITYLQPTPNVIFDLVQSNGTTIVNPSSSTATTKTYANLSGTYFVRVSGANSLNCYQFTVTSGLITKSAGNTIQQEVTKAPIKDISFDVKVFGNPSSAGFAMQVITDSDVELTVRVSDVNGRVIEVRQKLRSENIIRLGEKFRAGVYFAEIIQGKNRKTVKLIKM